MYKLVILLLLSSFIATAQDAPRTRILKYQIVDSVWSLIGDTVVAGNFYRQDIMELARRSDGYKVKQLDKKGSNVFTTMFINPYEDANDVPIIQTEPIVFEVKLSYTKRSTSVRIQKEREPLKDLVILEHQLKPFEL